MLNEHLIFQIHEAGHTPEAWKSILATISERFMGATVHLSIENNTCFGLGESWHHEFDDRVLDILPKTSEWGDACWLPENNKVIGAVVRSKTGFPTDRREYIPDDEFYDFTETRSYIGDQGLFHFAHCVCARDAETITGFWIGRSKRSVCFDEQDMLEMQFLSRHIGSALRMYRMVSTLRDQRDLYESSLAPLKDGVIHIDGNFRISYANWSAQAFLEAGEGVLCNAGRLVFSDNVTRQSSEQALQSILAGRSMDEEFLVYRSFSNLPFVASVFPAPGNSGTDRSRCQFIIFITDISNTENFILNPLLISHFGLSHEEARTGALLAKGWSVSKIAICKRVSVNSVKTQKKAIYAKTCTQTQSEFVKLVHNFKTSVFSKSQ